MAINQNLPATDSAAALHELIGDDATATFENDPKFVDSNPTEDGSSENLQTRGDRRDVQERPPLDLRTTEDDDDEDENEDEDLDDEDDLDEDEDDEDDEDLDDEDDLDEDEDEEDDLDEDDDEDEDDEEDDEE